MKLTAEQLACVEAARHVVPPERARDIVRLKNWEHGGCLCRNLEKPRVSPVTPEEDAAIRRLWDSLPGWTSWMTALSLLARE